jgi:predicted DCC family thiol-disulfide oxidoreductase YuxK
MDTSTLVYDGDCGFCTKSAKWILARSRSLEIVQWQAIKDLSSLGLTVQQVQTRAYFVRKNAVVAAGPIAIAESLKLCTKPWSYVGAFIKLPLISSASQLAYKSIARNRHKMPGSTDSCEIR